MTDAWADPCVPGAVLVGDAAGWNDPIIGQGLSISLRDARLVSEVLCSGRGWSVADFGGYVTERRERMRRLRFAAGVTTELQALADPAAPARRRAYNAAMATDPALVGARLVVQLGPEREPAESFEPATLERIRALA